MRGVERMEGREREREGRKMTDEREAGGGGGGKEGRLERNKKDAQRSRG